jgi:hypothetical protein
VTSKLNSCAAAHPKLPALAACCSQNKTLSIVAAKGSALPEGASLAGELARLFGTLPGADIGSSN